MRKREQNALLTERERRLREVGIARLERLKVKEAKIRSHLESERGKNDHQALHYLLHIVEGERNDLYHNLKDKTYVPKPRKVEQGSAKQIAKHTVRPQREPGPSPIEGATKHPIPRPVQGVDLPMVSNQNEGFGRNSRRGLSQ